jgi:hypothetical protein
VHPHGPVDRYQGGAITLRPKPIYFGIRADLFLRQGGSVPNSFV